MAAAPGELVEVHGTYWTAGNAPERGTVTFTPVLPAPMLAGAPDANPDRLVSQGKVVADLDEDGSFTVHLLASDDPGWKTDGPVLYRVVERLSCHVRSYLIAVPSDERGTDIASLQPETEDQGTVVLPVVGPQGLQGEVAVDPDPVTLPPGSQVVVEDLDPSPNRALVRFSIPQGLKGDKGEKGDKGDTGDPQYAVIGTDAPADLPVGAFFLDTDCDPEPQAAQPLRWLSDVDAPSDTPSGLVLGTTAVGQWGAVDPLVGHLAAADPHAQYAMRGLVGNLLTANQASGGDALGTTEGFGVFYNVAPTLVGDPGGRRIRFTNTAASPGSGRLVGPVSGRFPVVPGSTITFRCDATVPTGTFVAQIAFHDASGVHRSTLNSNLVVGGSGSAVVTGVVPAGMETVAVWLSMTDNGQGDWAEVDRLGLWEGAGGDWAMPGTPILNQGRRVSRPNGTDRLVEVWDGAAWVPVHYDSGTRDISSLITNGWTPYAAELRRIGSICHLSLVITGPGTSAVPMLLPIGFRTATNRVGGACAAETQGVAAAFMIASANAVQIFGTRTGQHRLTVSYPTPDPLPTSLPGTLVTTAP